MAKDKPKARGKAAPKNRKVGKSTVSSRKRGPAKGTAKTPGSGRKAGTPNKRTLEFTAFMEASKFDPREVVLAIARGDELDTTVVVEGVPMPAKARPSLELRGKMAAELMKYLWPQRKAVEVSNATDEEGNAQPFLVDSATNPGWLTSDEGRAWLGSKAGRAWLAERGLTADAE